MPSPRKRSRKISSTAPWTRCASNRGFAPVSKLLSRKRFPLGADWAAARVTRQRPCLGICNSRGKSSKRPGLWTLLPASEPTSRFFLFGGTALGISKGEEIYPLPDAPRRTLLIVSPKDIHVPTSDAYRWLHAPELASLTKSAANHKLFRFCALCWSAREASLSNDFEDAVFRRHPRLGEIKRDLLHGGASEALLAGSGSAVFGVFPSPAKARRAVVGFPHDQAFVCETISRSRYARLLKSAIVG